MITLQQIIEEALQIVGEYGPKYASIGSLIECQDVYQFFFAELLEIAQGIQPNNEENQLNQRQTKLTRIIIKEKLNQFDAWELVDFDKLITTLRYLKKHINFNPKYDYFHRICPSIFHAFQMIDILQGDCKQNSKLMNKFLNTTLNVLYSANPNQQSQSYQWIHNLNEFQRNKAKILVMNHLDFRIYLTPTQYQEYIGFLDTTDPQILSLLLQAKPRQQFQKARLQISELQLIKEDESWKLTGECRITEPCLTPEILVKCFSSCRLNYRFLLNHFFTETQTQIVFKYDIFKLDISKNQLVYFTFMDREHTQRQQFRGNLLMIFANAIYLINVLLSNQKHFCIYRAGSLQVLESRQLEKFIVFCLQMMHYCFRIVHEKNQHLNIVLEVPGVDLKICLCRIIQSFLLSPQNISKDVVNHICLLFSWLIGSKSQYKSIVQILFLHEEQKDKYLKGLFSQLMKRFLDENKDDELEYHTGMWFMRFSTLLEDPKVLLEGSYIYFCTLVFKFIVKSDKHRFVNSAQCRMVDFLQFVNKFLAKNSSFPGVTLSKWMGLLQQIQKAQRYESTQQYKWHILAVIFNDKMFPHTEEVKQRLINLLDLLNLQSYSINNETKDIWKQYLSKAGLNITQEITKQLDLLLHISQNSELMSSNWKKLYFFHRPPENLKDFVQSFCKLQLFLNASTTPISLHQAQQLSALLLTLESIFVRFEQETISQLCGCIDDESMVLAKKLYSSYSSSQSFSKIFQSKIRAIKSYLKSLPDSITANQIIWGLGQYLEQLRKNFKDPYLAAHILKLIAAIVKGISISSKFAFQPQFYNYHKKEIIQILEEMFRFYKFQFEKQCVATSLDPDFTLSFLIGDAQSKLKTWKQYHIPHLQRAIKQFILLFLDKRRWSYNSAIINNIKYQKVNGYYLFKRSIQSDLALRLSKICSIDNLNMFYRIYSLIVSEFNQDKQEHLKSEDRVLGIPISTQPLWIFKSQSDNKVYFDNYNQLLKKLFALYRNCKGQNIGHFDSIVISLRRDISKVHYDSFKLSTIKLYNQSLVYHLMQPDLDWARYERIHLIIGIDYIQFMDTNIAQAMPSRFIQLDLEQILRSMKNGRINKKNAFFFINFVDRMIPSSQPQQYDEEFYKYAMIVFKVAMLLRKMSDKLTPQKKMLYLRRLFQLKLKRASSIFDNQIMDLSTQIELGGSFSLNFCEIAEPFLRLPTIQLEIKSLFFKNQQYLTKDKHENWIKLTRVLELLLKKNKSHQDQLFKVLQAITYKKCIKQQEGEIVYITLKSQSSYQFSTFLSSNFADHNLQLILKSILSGFIERVNWNVNQNIKKYLPQLRIIMQQFPVLKGFILMYPVKSYKGKDISFINQILERALNEGYDDQQMYAFFVDACSDQCVIINNQGKRIFFSEIICYRLAAAFYKLQITCKILAFIFLMLRMKRFVNMCFKKLHRDVSLCDLLWEGLRQSDFRINSNLRVFICIVLSLLYRSRHIISALQHELKEKNEFSDQKWSMFVNYLYLATKNDQILKGEQKMKANDQNSEDYAQFDSHDYRDLYKLNYKAWFNLEAFSKQDDYSVQTLSLQQLRVKEQYQMYIGASIKVQDKKARGNRQTYKIKECIDVQQCKKMHKSTFDRLCTNFIKVRYSFNLQPSCFLYLHQNDLYLNKKQPKKQDLSEINLPYQSRYAPQQTQKIIATDLDKLYRQVVSKLGEKVGQQLNQKELTQIYSKLEAINKKLAQQQKEHISIQDIFGKSKEQALLFLQQIDLEIEFDSNLMAMNCQQFQTYCLSNVSRLNRLKSDRRNIVRRIQDEMMLSFVQRTVSSDSIGYVIDTIDENYQYLSDLKKQAPHPQVQSAVSLIPSEQLPSHIFEDISDENIYQIILSLYKDCSHLPIDFMVPFIENKRIQGKIINTLLIISKDPFQTEHFPSLYEYTEQNESHNRVYFEKILMKVLSIGKFYSFYHTDNYFNSMFSFEGVKGLRNVSLFQTGQQEQTYKPVYDCIDLILDCLYRNFQLIKKYEYSQYLFALSGVEALTSSQWTRLLLIFQEMERELSQPRDEMLSLNAYKKIAEDLRRYQIGLYLKSLLKSKKSRKRIREKFPLEKVQRNVLFICLLKDTGVYSKQELLAKHRYIIAHKYPSNATVYFSNVMFSLYSEEELKDISWFTESGYIQVMIDKLTLEFIIQFIPNLPFKYKKILLYKKINEFKNRIYYSGGDKIVAQRRKGIFQSAFLDLRAKPDAFWYQKFFVKFMSEQDRLQSGHGGGVQKYWYSLITSEMVNPNYGIFAKTSKNYYFFSRESWINPRHLQYLQFIGKLFAISIIHQDLFLTPSFSILLYKMIVGQTIEIQDVVDEFDEGEVITNLQKLKDYTANNQFCETFTYVDKRLISRKAIQTDKCPSNPQVYLVKEAVEMDQTFQNTAQLAKQQQEFEEMPIKMIKVLKVGETIELIPGGSNIPVTLQNREQFITLTKQKILSIIIEEVKQQFDAFMTGFSRICRPSFIKNITASELRNIAEGFSQISVTDIKRNANIESKFEGSTMIWFWECLQQLTEEERSLFIQHWTGLPKIPAEGVQALNLRIGKGNTIRLYAQTCFNKIYIPEVQSKAKMSQLMGMVVNSIKFGTSIIED